MAHGLCFEKRRKTQCGFLTLIAAEKENEKIGRFGGLLAVCGCLLVGAFLYFYLLSTFFPVACLIGCCTTVIIGMRDGIFREYTRGGSRVIQG